MRRSIQNLLTSSGVSPSTTRSKAWRSAEVGAWRTARRLPVDLDGVGGEQAVELGLGDVRDGAVLAETRTSPADARAGDGDGEKRGERDDGRGAVRERREDAMTKHPADLRLEGLQGCVADELVRAVRQACVRVSTLR